MSNEERAPEQAAFPQTPDPHPELQQLLVLEGTWRLEGEDLGTGVRFTGTITREWLPGGHFLVQRTETDGHPQVGAEYIGYDTAASSLRSMLFSDEGPGPFCPFALEYFWQIDGDSLTIWHGHRDSPARFSGAIDREAGRVSGAWQWPGGGYTAVSTRTG